MRLEEEAISVLSVKPYFSGKIIQKNNKETEFPVCVRSIIFVVTGKKLQLSYYTILFLVISQEIS